MLPEIKRFADRLLHSLHASTTAGALPSRAMLLDNAHYHMGDHWQSLLASPMDARHYVFEDWNTAAPAFELADESYVNEPYTRGETRSMRRRQA
jgi:hypothetical protein